MSTKKSEHPNSSVPSYEVCGNCINSEPVFFKEKKVFCKILKREFDSNSWCTGFRISPAMKRTLEKQKR